MPGCVIPLQQSTRGDWWWFEFPEWWFNVTNSDVSVAQLQTEMVPFYTTSPLHQVKGWLDYFYFFFSMGRAWSWTKLKPKGRAVTMLLGYETLGTGYETLAHKGVFWLGSQKMLPSFALDPDLPLLQAVFLQAGVLT